MVFFSRSILNTLYVATFLSTFLGTFNAQANDDEYMKQLEVEAEGLHLDSRGQRANDAEKNGAGNQSAKQWTGECDYANDALSSGVVWEEFSSYVKKCHPGDYAYYRRLGTSSQHSVYDRYVKKPSMNQSTFKQEILKYF